MSFFAGMIIGIFASVALIFGYVQYSHTRSVRRAQLAKTVAALSKMTVEDSKKILGENFPPWLDWLNAQLEKIWPYINEAASELIRSNVEPVLEQYRPAILTSLKFSKLTLGTVPPIFTGISIIESESGSDGISMEFEVQWDGNPKIVLDINTRVGVALPVEVKNIGFTGVFRLIFKPLLEEFPCFGAVSYSLREKSQLDFKLKVIGGDLTSIPGISDAIDETIRDAVEDSITWPIRKVLPILPGDYSDLELKPVGTLDVKLVQAKDLVNKDLIGKSDPFAKLFIRPLPGKTKRSKTISNQLNPIWNEHYEFVVEDVSTQHLTVRIFDDEGIQASELIGAGQVPLGDLEPGKVRDVWLKLVKDLDKSWDTRIRGQVHLELLYCPSGMESSLKKPFNVDYSLTTLEKILKPDSDSTESPERNKKREVIVRGVLSVTVIAAEDLPSVDFMGKADPFVVIIMKKSETKAKTRVVPNSLNPVWNQTFDFVIEDAPHELLMMEVWDHDSFGKDKMGRVIMTLTRVMLEGEVAEWFQLDAAKSGRLHCHLKWTPQLKFRESG